MAIKLFRYKVEDEILAFGGMGEVYKAIDILSDKQVIIKTINTHALDIDEKTLNTFIKEAQASFRLGQFSKHIVKVIDLGNENNVPFMVQEYMAGGNLSQKIGNVSNPEAIDILWQLSKAVKTAHDNKIIHSDISPDNILFDTESGNWKLCDFGILKIIETHLLTRGRTLHRGGKPMYMPPLHFFNIELVSELTDLYALGMIYYVLITGELLKVVSSNPPQIPNPVIIKHTGEELSTQNRKIIKKCIQSEFDGIDKLISELDKVRDGSQF